MSGTFAKHGVEFMFIGKSGAILLGYPSTTQDVDLFPKKSKENGRRILAAIVELGFATSGEIEEKILAGADFVQLKNGPFDLDLVFAPDGIESFEAARKRMTVIDGFPVASIGDIISSKKASGREKDLVDLPLLEDFKEEFEKRQRGDLKSSLDIAMEKLKKADNDLI